jgi:hypothetical protein
MQTTSFQGPTFLEFMGMDRGIFLTVQSSLAAIDAFLLDRLVSCALSRVIE